jgi:hypothetical protein
MTDVKPTDIDVLSAFERSIRSKVRTLSPATVLTYDDTAKTAKVQLHRRWTDSSGQLRQPPIIPAAPVCWPRFGGMIVMGRLNPGDEVIAGVCERDIEKWLQKGGSVDPGSDRTHHLIDTIVMLSLASRKKPMPPSAGQFRIGREDGTATVSFAIDGPGVITIEAPTIRMGQAATHPAILGTAMTNAFTAWSAAMATAGAAAATAGADPSGAAAAAYAAAVTAATATLAATIANWPSTKILVE